MPLQIGRNTDSYPSLTTPAAIRPPGTVLCIIIMGGVEKVSSTAAMWKVVVVRGGEGESGGDATFAEPD